MTQATTALTALGIASLLIFSSDGKKRDGSPLFYRRPKDGNPGVVAQYSIVAPDHDNVSGLGAKSIAKSGLEYIEAYVAVHGGEGEKTEYYNIRLFKNDKKTLEAQPIYRGFIEKGSGDEAVRVADASGFLKKDKNGNPFLSVALQEPWVKPEGASERAEADGESSADFAPF